MLALPFGSDNPCLRWGYHRIEGHWVPARLRGAGTPAMPYRPTFDRHNREINLRMLRHWDCGVVTAAGVADPYQVNFIQLVSREAGIRFLGLFESKACALVPVLEEFIMHHEKTNGYIIRFNEVWESHNRILHSTQCSIEEVTVILKVWGSLSQKVKKVTLYQIF